MKIYRQQTEIYDIRPEDNSTQRVVHMGENVLNLTFKTTYALDLQVNDYVIFEDEKYKLKRPVNPTRRGLHEYEYNCQLMAPQYDLQDALYILEDDTGVGILDENISINGTASFHLKQIVKCLQEVHSEWVMGDVEETDEEKNITYSEMDCLQALQHLASEFNTEYWIRGNSISLGKKKHGNPIVFKFGKGEAFYELTRQNHEGRIVTALRVRGSDRNINSEKSGYGNKYLLMPGKERYVYRNVNKYGILHGRMNFPDVYPRLIHKKPTDPGSITSIRVDENGFYFIKDQYLDFEPEILPDKDKNLVVDFQSGQLNGLKIDANWHSDTKEYELIKGDYGLAQQVPADVFVPKVGDRYLLSDLKMPQAYIDAAERELKEKAEEAIAQLCEQKVSYKGVVNPLFFRMLGERAETGRAVVVEDADIVDNDGKVELRIQALTRNVNDDLSLDIEISDTLYVSRIDRIETELQEHKNDTNEKINYGDAYTKRRFRDVQELYEYLQKSHLNFSEAIDPIAIHSMQAFFGDVNLQFRFVDKTSGYITKPEEVDHPFTYNDDTKMFHAPKSIIQHMTLGIDTMAPSHEAIEYNFWDIAVKSEPITDTKARWIYLKCSKIEPGKIGIGTIELKEEAVEIESEAGYYYFLAGFLNSEFDGTRSLVPMYGYTEITPGQMRVNKILNPDGDQYWDMLNGRFKIGNKDTFLSWNTPENPNKLVLKGTLIQSGSGDENFPGVYRGTYNSTYTYYPGDEVSYASNGSISTYRYKYATPTKGNVPTNTIYWQVIAQGAKGDNGNDGAKGDNGINGDYFEYRYAVNGSRTSPPVLSYTSPVPSGWDTTMPYVGSLKYLWCTVAKKSASGALIQNWSIPTRVTGYDGTDGEKGEKGDRGPTVVYRGIYNSSTIYYGTDKRVDCVKHKGNETYYIATVDAGNGFNNQDPTTPKTKYWNEFGAQFESVATHLLLAEKANIGDWYHDSGKIVSTLSSGNKITLDASMAKILMESNKTGGTTINNEQTSLDSSRSSLKMDAIEGLIEARNENGVSYISASGIFSNNANTNAVSATLGITRKASIVGLGFGNLNKSQWDNENFIAGVYGTAFNKGTSPAYGGFFQNLLAAGLILRTRAINETSSSVYLTESDSLVVGYSRNQQIVYLPNDGIIGRTIFFKQWWTGYMRIYPKSGQILYDDSSANSYYDIGEGWGAICHFTIGYVNNVKKEAWLISRFKY